MLHVRILITGGLALCFATAGTWWSLADEQIQQRVTPIPAQTDQSVSHGQPVGPLMQAKLSHAQRVMEGLVTHDFTQVGASAHALKHMSLDPPDGWKKSDAEGEVYEHFRLEFMRQSAQLEKMASQKNLEGAAWYQQNLTSTCIACHNYIRDYKAED